MIEQIIFGNAIKDYIISFAIIILFLGLGRLFSLIGVKILKHFAKKTETVLDDVLIDVLEKPIIMALFIVGFRIGTDWLTFGPRGDQIASNIITVLIVFNITWAVIKLCDSLIDHFLAPISQKNKSGLDEQVLPFIKKTLRVIIVVIGLIFLIKNMGYDVTSLIAGLGIGGLAFALAAQPLLTNLFGGIAILTDKPFQIGDRVRIDQRYEGYVKEMGMRSTIIRTANDTLVQIPNSVIATTAIENLSATEEHAIRVVFNIGLEYSTSSDKVEEAIEIIKKILQKHKNVVQDAPIAPFVGFTEFRDSTLNIACGYSLSPPSKSTQVRTEVNLEIKRALEKAHIHMAFPTQTVYVKKD